MQPKTTFLLLLSRSMFECACTCVGTCVQLQTSASISSEKGGMIIDRHEREEFREKNMEGDMENRC